MPSPPGTATRMCNEFDRDILFRGGQISVGIGGGTLESGEIAVGVKFQSIGETHEIGSRVDLAKQSGPATTLVFINPDSVDVVIGQLIKAKEFLVKENAQKISNEKIPT